MNLKQFSKLFNITNCYDKRFMKRKGGYLFTETINNEIVDIVVSLYDKNNQLVIFSGDITRKTIQSLQEVEYVNFKIISKKLLAEQ